MPNQGGRADGRLLVQNKSKSKTGTFLAIIGAGLESNQGTRERQTGAGQSISEGTVISKGCGNKVTAG